MLRSSSTVSADWANIREAVLRRDDYKCLECGKPCRSAEADVHHLLPRSAGGADEPSNLVTLCDGCHAAHHPKLAGRLARRAMEKWAVWLALWLDRRRAIPDASRNYGAALRLFGLERFRDGQLPVVEAALSGQSVLVVSPTGFGKSLCFQLPAILRSGVSVVVSPLKALMGEQVSALLRHKIPSTFINSDLDPVEKQIRYQLLANKVFKLLYAAPERFFVQNKSELQMLWSLRPSFLVIDEAHCVDQWGRDFRPEYGRLGEVHKALGSPPVLAFTATAGQEMQKRILASLGVNGARVFVRGVDRPNISLLRWEVLPNERLETIAQLCHIPIKGKVMIFVPTQKIGEALQDYLRDQGLETPFYHSKLGSAWDREQLVKRFVGESYPLVDRIICTSAFGMGLDVPNVRLVIHYQHPSSVEEYLQEFGRAGRDGQPSVAVLLHADFGATKDKDIGLLNFMAEKASDGAQLDAANQTGALDHKYRQIQDMARLVRQEGCFRQTLIAYFEGSEKGSRRSFSTRLLEWVFAEPATGGKNVVCCDACCCDVIKQWGEIGFVSKVFGLRLSLAYSERAGHRQSETGHRQIGIAGIAAFIGGAAILSIVMLLVFFQGKSTDTAKPQAIADSSVHADRTPAVASLQGANKLNPPPSDIMAAQNRLIELGFLKGPADGVWGTKSRMALRAFKVANGLAGDDKWDDLVSSQLYSTQAARSPLPLATTGR